MAINTIHSYIGFSTFKPFNRNTPFPNIVVELANSSPFFKPNIGQIFETSTNEAWSFESIDSELGPFFSDKEPITDGFGI